MPSFRGTPLKGFTRLAKKMARSGSLSPVERFLMNCTYMDAKQREKLLTPVISKEVEVQDPYERHRSCFKEVDHADFLNQMLYAGLRRFS